MDDDTTEPFGFPAISRKKVAAAFDGGRLTSDGGICCWPRPSATSGSVIGWRR
jgi:hypothetical protein